MKRVVFVLRMILWSIVFAGFLLFAASFAGIQTYVVLSGSMEPVIHTGSIILVNTHEKRPEKGDIITYRLGEIKVTHRVKSVQKDGTYETRGDANELSDAEYVAKEQILGCVLGTIPYLGYFLIYLRSPKSLICFACLLLIDIYGRLDEEKIKRGEQETYLQVQHEKI